MNKSIFKRCSALLMFWWLLLDATAASAQTSLTTNNWAGYMINDAAYSNVSASWVVPTVDCSAVAASGYTASYAWVGLGGYSDVSASVMKVIEQIGTAQFCKGTTPAYYLYLEFLPAGPSFGDSRYPLAAGDTVTAKVTRNFDGTYTLSETATSKGAKLPKWQFSTTGTAPGTSTSDPGNTSAEIIVEQPSSGSTPIPVSNYGSITFFNLAYTKASTAPDHATTVEFSNSLGGNTLSTSMAVPSVLSPTSFIVYQF